MALMTTPRDGRSSHFDCDPSSLFHHVPTHPWVSLRADRSPDGEVDDDESDDDGYESFPPRDGGAADDRFSEVALSSPDSADQERCGGIPEPSLERITSANVVAHVDRVDLGGSPYTAYVVRVRGQPVCAPLHGPPESSPEAADGLTVGSRGGDEENDDLDDHRTPRFRGAVVLVERRYSDFRKLRARLRPHYWNGDPQHGDDADGFPQRIWAASRYLRSLSSESHRRDVAEQRLVRLDAWLVRVLQDCEAGGPLSGNAPREAIRDFLFASRAPCDQPLALQGLDEEPLPPTTPVARGPFHHRSDATIPPTPRRNRSLSSIGGAAVRYHNPWTTTLGSALRQSVQTIRDLTSHADASIPCDLLRAAQGLLFLTVAKGGLVVSGRFGSGLVVARLLDRRRGRGAAAGGHWSAPCAVAVAGLGWGALAGGDVTHFLVVLTSRKATLDLVSSSSRLQLGAELGIAVGPLGRGANSQVHRGGWSVHTAYAYAISHGLFAGVSLEGTVLRVRDDVNAVFYGRPVLAPHVLQQPGVAAAEPLYRALERAAQVDIPDGAFRPSEYFS